MNGKSELTESDWLQIEMAARGCVSGQLREWPKLQSALRKLGLDAVDHMDAWYMRDVCNLAIMLKESE